MAEFYVGVFVSRCANSLLLGRWEMVCSRVYRQQWIVAEVFIDCCFAHNGVGHCRRMYEWELAERK